jgi:DNA-binding NarL/FixJ family response regulator
MRANASMRRVALCTDALEDTRALSRLLRPPILDDLGSNPPLRGTRPLDRRSQRPVDRSRRRTAARLDGDLQTLVFRVAQEALNNAAKHAQAKAVLGAPRGARRFPAMQVADDGRGLRCGRDAAFGTAAAWAACANACACRAASSNCIRRPGEGTRLRAVVPRRMIRHLLADDHTLVRESLVSLLQAGGDVQVVAQAPTVGDRAEGHRHASRTSWSPTSRMPRLNGIEVVRRLREAVPHVRVLVLTMHERDEYVLQAVRAGAAGYLVKDSAAEELLAAVRSLHAGRADTSVRRRRRRWPNRCSIPSARSTIRTDGSRRASARCST